MRRRVPAGGAWPFSIAMAVARFLLSSASPCRGWSAGKRGLGSPVLARRRRQQPAAASDEGCWAAASKKNAGGAGA